MICLADTMPATSDMITPPRSLAQRILLRILSILIAAAILACLTNFFTWLSNRQPGPAGFSRGVIHGALMPCALPSLLVGRNVPIYSVNNTGRTYNLGYTVGVNGCGAIFFGAFFWRINRWRRSRRQ